MILANHTKILVTGSTGYIGGRLVPALLAVGYQVRVLVRDPQRLEGRAWLNDVDVYQGDVLKTETLAGVFDGVSAAYYLVHSMAGGDDFHSRDMTAANNFSNAAKEAKVKQIIYLGGLGDYQADLSEHLKSRQDTGRALAKSGVPITEFRAAVIVGSGSISFEMIRYLSERVPFMICPKWVFTKTQPIAIRDVLDYLISALTTPESFNKIIEIGGENVLTYGDMMLGYAQERGLKRILIPVPFLTPQLSAYWVHWVTPVSAEIAHALVEGLRNEALVTAPSAAKIFPEIVPVDYQTAVKTALSNLAISDVETRWTDSLVSSLGEEEPVKLTTLEGLIMEQRQKRIQADREKIFHLLTGLGGNRGWLYMNWAWQLRGVLDRLLGGVGLRRGRRDPDQLRMGDALDFWRVEEIQDGTRLRLRSEMITPGEAWLQYDLEQMEGQQVLLKQSAFFAPRGLPGLLYWYILYPFHSMIFSGLIRGIKEKSEL